MAGMTAATLTASVDPPPGEELSARRCGRPRLGRAAVLVIFGLYFAVPILASFLFTVDDPVKGFNLSAYSQIFSVAGLWPALRLSLELAVATIGATSMARPMTKP